MMNTLISSQVEVSPLGILPTETLPEILESMVNFLPVKENYGGSWVVTLPPIPEDSNDPGRDDIITIHQVFQANKKADKHAFLALLLTDNQALNEYAELRGEAAEDTLAEIRHKAKNEGFLVDPETNQFNNDYLREQREKSSQRTEAITKAVIKLMGIMQEKREAVEKFKPTFKEVETKYKLIDEHYDPKPSYGSSAWEEWIKARLNVFGGKVVLGTDVDLTLTTHADYLQFVPGSHHAESLLKAYSREIFPVVFVRYWQEALRRIPQVFGRVGRRIEPRQGVWQFFESAEKRNQPLVIMSANFEPIVKGMLQSLPQKSIAKVYAVSAEDISATDKETVLKEIVSRYPDRAMTVFEDGESGLPLINDNVSGLVACYFALEGSKFHEALSQTQLPYYTFRDFNDNLNNLRKAGVL